MNQNAPEDKPPEVRSPLTPKERIDIVLKEYDSARKELEEDIRFLSTLTLTVGLSVAAGAWGLRDRTNLSLAFLIIPLVLILRHAGRARRLYNSVQLGRVMAYAEQRIYEISGEALLRHETHMVMSRFRKNWRYFYWQSAYVLAYLAIAGVLYSSLEGAARVAIHRLAWIHKMILISIFVIPAFLAIRYDFKRAKLQARPFETSLARRLKQSDYPHLSVSKTAT